MNNDTLPEVPNNAVLEVKIDFLMRDISVIKTDVLRKVLVRVPMLYAFVIAVMGRMFGMSRKYLEITKSVVAPYPVLVMDYLALGKEPAKLFLHDKPMFPDVPLTTRGRMVWLPDMNVAMHVDNPATLAVRTPAIGTVPGAVRQFYMRVVGKLLMTDSAGGGSTREGGSAHPATELPTRFPDKDGFALWAGMFHKQYLSYEIDPVASIP